MAATLRGASTWDYDHASEPTRTCRCLARALHASCDTEYTQRPYNVEFMGSSGASKFV
jgi:hypothetical protein